MIKTIGKAIGKAIGGLCLLFVIAGGIGLYNSSNTVVGAKAEEFGPPIAPQKRQVIAKASAIDEWDATLKCEIAAKLSSRHPSTVSFSKIWDAEYTSYGDKANLRSTFTAKNSFGAQTKFDIVCDFKGEAIIGVTVTEAFN